MIVDQPITADLTLGADRRIVQDGDTQLVVPPVITPVVLSLRPTSLVQQPVGPAIDDSRTFHFFAARVNQAALSSPTVVLNKGLWELEFTMATSFDYTAAPPLATLSGAEIQLGTALATVSLLTRFPQIGSFTDFGRCRVLLREATTVFVFTPASGAAQNIAQKACVNAIRII